MEPSAPTFAVIIPFFNESLYLPACLRSWLAQTRLPDQIILADNASTDGSADLARALLARSGIKQVVHLREPRPGKIHALEAACRHIACDFAAFADADITYPPWYLETAERLFRTGRPDTVAVMALYLHDRSDDWAARAYRRVMPWLSHLFPTKCLTGGGGQVFRTASLRTAGGFSEAFWKYVLLDHEVMARMLKLGPSRYHPDFWCLHTNRRGDRKAVRWTVWERFLYLYMPPPLLDWFFYDFLGPRLRARNMGQSGLRAQPWARRQGGTGTF
jgi:glycosyltransferase involved in cell wall biosynthesis